jgi:hypothetical protein
VLKFTTTLMTQSWYSAKYIEVLEHQLLFFGALDFRGVEAEAFAVRSEPVFQQTIPLSLNYSKNRLPQLGAQLGAVKAMHEHYLNRKP